jgi:hypothetical protein
MISAIFRDAAGDLWERDVDEATLETCRVFGTTYFIAGEYFTRCIGEEFRRDSEPAEKRRERPRYPIRSNSLNVGKIRADDLRKKLAEKGVSPTCVDNSGRVVFESDQHRRTVARAMGMVSQDSYFD